MATDTGEKLTYKLESNKLDEIIFKKSSRTRSIRISVHHNGRVVVTAPTPMPQFLVRRFVASKREWIDAKLAYFAAHPEVRVSAPTRRSSRKDFLEHKDAALALVTSRLEHFNRYYNHEYKNVTIRNQKTRWGSCSRKKNLNFNYKIVFLTPEQQDYIVVHELCHLAQMNHGAHFWALVAEQVPQHKTIRASIRKFRL